MKAATPKSNEQIYDEEIAPELLRLCNRCKELGMSFVANVEFDPAIQGVGTTEFMMPDEGGKLSASQRLVHWAARSKGNIDKLFMACDQHGHKYGHSSVYLQQIGNKNVKYNGSEVAAITVIKP